MKIAPNAQTYDNQLKKALKIYLIINDMHVLEQKYLQRIQWLLANGVTMVQIRFKTLEYDQKVYYGTKIKGWAQANHVKFIVNDDIALAVKLEAAGVHLGWDDIYDQEIGWENKLQKQIKAQKLLWGISVGNQAQLEKALTLKPDYISLGAVYDTISKKNYTLLEKGIDYATILHQAQMPFVYIGGLKLDNLKTLLDTKPNGFCFISFLLENPQQIKPLKQLLLAQGI